MAQITALDKALQSISYRMKTEREIRSFLQKKGYLDDVVAFVVERMREYRYIDDAAYAEAYCESEKNRKGRLLIAAELRKKGVSDADMERALSALTGEEESAAALLRKYLRGKEPDRKTLSSAYRYLMGKGYDYETAQNALKTLRETEDED